MCANNLQIIGCQRLQKRVLGCSVALGGNSERANLSSPPNKQKIFSLWQRFMTNHYRKLAPYFVDDNILSIEEPLIKNQLKKWAAIEVTAGCQYQTDEVKTLTITGQYFGFIHTGTAEEFSQTYQHAIDYLQRNQIQIDPNRPRLEIMHRSYLPDNPSSQEQFWIPVLINN